jgi:hypothetical protein
VVWFKICLLLAGSVALIGAVWSYKRADSVVSRAGLSNSNCPVEADRASWKDSNELSQLCLKVGGFALTLFVMIVLAGK